MNSGDIRNNNESFLYTVWINALHSEILGLKLLMESLSMLFGALRELILH